MKKLLTVFMCLFLTGCGSTISIVSSQLSSNPEYIYDSVKIYTAVSDMLTTHKNVATLEIISTRTETSPSTENEEKKDYYLFSKAKIINAYRGNLKSGDIIYLYQLGDGSNTIWQSTDTTLGYYQKGQRYLTFMSAMDFDEQFRNQFNIVKNDLVFYANPYTGQFLINKNNEIIKHPSEYDLFPDAKTVDDIIEQIP